MKTKNIFVAFTIGLVFMSVAFAVNSVYFDQFAKEKLFMWSFFSSTAKEVINNISDMQQIRDHYWYTCLICLMTNVIFAVGFFVCNCKSKLLAATIIGSGFIYFLMMHFQAEVISFTIHAAILTYVIFAIEFAAIYCLIVKNRL